MMGGQSSKKKGSDATPPALQMNIDSQFSADLSSYEAACTLDPDLQSFDNIIHERTSRVISSLSTSVEDGVDEERYVKTLEELKKFKEAGNPFTEEFFTLFQLVYKQQLSMLQKLQRRKRKLDKKLKSMKTWRMVVVDLEVLAANKDQLLVGLMEELEIDLAVFFEQQKVYLVRKG
ncbi:hypothetical protein Pint_26998 [Pistacia integerrima]|uniref:Uncharacterized protein n=1 Tax=Pistacia integerrima TaxID=434235 RepID=A0ACC0YN53_9ROSI|nr:hypothetical protein Pint_26998 [Pistacia integerrima]